MFDNTTIVDRDELYDIDPEFAKKTANKDLKGSASGSGLN